MGCEPGRRPGSLPRHLPRPPPPCIHRLRTLNDTLFLLKSTVLCTRNDTVLSAFIKEGESLQEAAEREEEARAARAVWGPRPTEGAPTPRNAGARLPPAGREGRLTSLQAALGLPEQRRCQLRAVAACGGQAREGGWGA